MPSTLAVTCSYSRIPAAICHFSSVQFQRHILSEERIDESVPPSPCSQGASSTSPAVPKPRSKLTTIAPAMPRRHVRFSRRAVTVVRDRDSILPITLGRGAPDPVHSGQGCVPTALWLPSTNVLRSSGADLTRMIAGEADLWISEDDVNSFDCILVHLLFCPTRSTARVRPGGMYMRTLSRLLSCRHPRVVPDFRMAPPITGTTFPPSSQPS